MMTAKNLELIRNVMGKKGHTLLKVLDSTITRMGHRLLRMNVLQPLCGIFTLLS
jgi:DNA mismatch repair ATPase MutS